MKLLLDCPEHIWRCLEKEDYLSAARLDSVGRAVYRELVSTSKKRAGRNNMHGSSADSDNDETGYDSDQEDEGDESGLLSAFPLVEQQFDSLDQLAPQISSRATLHLRSWDVPALVSRITGFNVDTWPTIDNILHLRMLRKAWLLW